MDSDNQVEDVEYESVQNEECELAIHSHCGTLPENEINISVPTLKQTPKMKSIWLETLIYLKKAIIEKRCGGGKKLNTRHYIDKQQLVVLEV